jgi:hypothetical protein
VTRLLIPVFLALAVLVLAALFIIWLRRARINQKSAIERILVANGAARCVEAARTLRTLATSNDQAAIAGIWDGIELPLLQALPDCPPDYKIELINALDACAKACSNREVTKRIMTLRNSLIN